MHTAQNALGHAPALNGDSSAALATQASAPAPAYILRLSRELVQRCVEPLVCEKIMHVYEPHDSDQDFGHGDHIATRRLAPLHVCREFRIVGLDICYHQNNFAFRSDEQLQSFLTHVDPEQIKRIQHIILEDLITVHFSRSTSREKDADRHTRIRGVFNYAALESFTNLKTVHLQIATELDATIAESDESLACMTGTQSMAKVLGLQDYPFDIPWPTHKVVHPEEVERHEALEKCWEITRDRRKGEAKEREDAYWKKRKEMVMRQPTQ